MKGDQSKAPIVDAIRQYHESGITPFTTPGHKRGAGIQPGDIMELGSSTFFNDIPMQNGADDRRESKGIQEKAEQLAAEAVGADQSFFSTNGSSLSAHTAILSVANFGDKILVTRNTHKSMVGALVMADVLPVFLEPEVDPDFDIQHGVSPEHLEEMLCKHPDVKGVFIVSPTYYGVTSDVASLAAVCHKRDIPLVVDEAWGPHLAFHPELPKHALSCGADMSFGSVHKTMNGLGQASVISLKGKRIGQDRFTLCFDLFESTSPSSLILASTDAARRQMALHGETLWGNALRLGRYAREALKDVPGLTVLDKQVLNKPGAFDLDETKLVLDVQGLGISGYLAADWMLEHFKITVELITHRHLMALITVADTDETVDLLVRAVKALCDWAAGRQPDTYPPLPPLQELRTHQVMSPAKAFFSATKKVPLDKAAGEVIAEIVSPYPPGIPRLIPGELITPAILEYLKEGHDAGMFLLDPSDQELKTLRVVDHSKTSTAE